MVAFLLLSLKINFYFWNNFRCTEKVGLKISVHLTPSVPHFLHLALLWYICQNSELTLVCFCELHSRLLKIHQFFHLFPVSVLRSSPETHLKWP